LDADDSFASIVHSAMTRLPTLEGSQITVVQWPSQSTQMQSFPALSQLVTDVPSAFPMSTEYVQ